MLRIACCFLLVSAFFSHGSAEPTPKKDANKSANKQRTDDMTVAGSVAVAEYQRTDVLPEIEIRRASRYAVGGKISSSSMRNYGYPFNSAPTLPPFLQSRSDSPSKSYVGRPLYSKEISTANSKSNKETSEYGKRKKSYEDKAEESIAYPNYSPTYYAHQSYREPRYRNFDDLDSSYRPQPVEYRGYSQVYGPTSDSNNPYRQRYVSNPDLYHSKVKPGSSISKYPKKYGHRRYQDDYPKDSYKDYDVKPSKNYNYGSSGYAKDKYYDHYNPHYSKSDSQEEFALPHPSPIVGDIRKRLLDYAGASDLFIGEPDYLKEAFRKRKYEPTASDYYPFRRADIYTDLAIDESKRKLSATKRKHQ